MRNLSVARILPLGLCLFVLLVFSSCCAKKQIASGTQMSIGLDTVISGLKIQVEKANQLFQHYVDSLKQKQKLKLETAAISLQTTGTKNATGSISIWIIKPTYTNKIVHSSSLTFNLDTTPIPKHHFDEILGQKKIDYTMANYIYNSAVEFYRLNQSPLPGLNKQSFDIDIVFSIENDYNGGITFTVFGAGIDASYEYDKAVQHEIKLNYRFDPPGN